ncbi:JmjC-domain-containing protein [Auricularia subglabra TFB-10046 SS5]|nr:JmjC-domain-containing protein [Auricularia subglabra TFB-10046 SS5]
MSVREWHELCSRDELRTPGVLDGADRRDRVHTAPPRQARAKRGVKQNAPAPTPTPAPDADEDTMDVDPALLSLNDDSKAGSGRRSHKERMEARAERDAAFLAEFEPHVAWLPPATTADDYTPEFCRTLERMFWRSLGLGRPAWYGADSAGSLFTDETAYWNVAKLPSLLTRLLPGNTQMPGVNTPYLYFGMWRATFAWHVEDMDLFSINYVHFGAPKHWYAIPQQRAAAFETIMKSNFPSDISKCPQFLRHKAFLMSPSKLVNASCRPNMLVQHAGEFVITYPRGYHAGFNMGFNCAESVNFALDSWLDLGRKAAYCTCISDSVRINVDELLLQRAEELEREQALNPPVPPPTATPTRTSKRKAEHDDSPGYKKIRFTPINKLPQVLTEQPSYKPPAPSPPRPIKPRVSGAHEELGPPLPCCLCASTEIVDLLPVHDPPLPSMGTAPSVDEHGKSVWRAHESCARVVPETWVDTGADGARYVFGVDAVVKDRWNLKCQLCKDPRAKGHGAPIQCTKGKCPRAFHVSCLAACAAATPASPASPPASADALDNPIFSPSTTSPGATTSACTSITGSAAHPAPPASSAPSPSEVSYKVLCEVDKEVVADDGRVISTIRKSTVEVFCAQHNPRAKAERKRGREEKQRSQLLALPLGSRIRVRVSSGVYEVSLVRVEEEEQTVEVLWDDNVKRTFRWGSIIWHGDNLMKPDMDSAPPGSTKPVLITPSASATANANAAASTSAPPAAQDKPVAGPSKPTATKASTKAPLPYPYYPPPPPGYFYAPFPMPFPPAADGKSVAPPPPMPYPPPPPGKGAAPAYPFLPPGVKPPAYPYPPPPPPNGKAPYGYPPFGYYPPHPPPGVNMRYYPSAVYQTPGAPPVAGKAKANGTAKANPDAKPATNAEAQVNPAPPTAHPASTAALGNAQAVLSPTPPAVCIPAPPTTVDPAALVQPS